MAASTSSLLGAFILLLLQCLLLAAQTTICPESDYIMGPSGEHCYRYFQSPQTFAAAQKVCERDFETIEGTLVIIGSQDEDDFVNDELFVEFGDTEFWIGLNDQEEEGIFRWVDGTTADTFFLNWSPVSPNDNTESHDCVKYAADGWRVHDDGCEVSTLPFVCEVETCESADGEVCIRTDTTSAPSDSGVDVTVIAAVVVIVIVGIVVIVVVVVLLYVWKFHNDTFFRYICCCAGRGSKSAVHSLQQENQRLRHELSQHKVSLSGSGRYSQGQFARELSGVPDGRGGVLPTIKRGGMLSPTIPEDRPITFSPTLAQPPPLIPQRGHSKVTPLYRPPSLTSPPPVFGPHHSLGRNTFPRQLSLGVPPSVVVGKPSFPVVQKPGEKKPQGGELKQVPPAQEEVKPAEEGLSSSSSSSAHSEQEQAA